MDQYNGSAIRLAGWHERCSTHLIVPYKSTTVVFALVLVDTISLHHPQYPLQALWLIRLLVFQYTKADMHQLSHGSAYRAHLCLSVSQ